jgi:hypothetical protein
LLIIGKYLSDQGRALRLCNSIFKSSACTSSCCPSICVSQRRRDNGGERRKSGDTSHSLAPKELVIYGGWPDWYSEQYDFQHEAVKDGKISEALNLRGCRNLKKLAIVNKHHP